MRRHSVTNSDSTREAREPNPRIDSNARGHGSGSNGRRNNIDSSGLCSDTGNTVRDNNKPRLTPEQSRQHRARPQALVEAAFSYVTRLLDMGIVL